MHSLAFAKNDGNTYVRDMLSESRKNIIVQNSVRLRPVIKKSSFAVVRSFLCVVIEIAVAFALMTTTTTRSCIKTALRCC